MIVAAMATMPERVSYLEGVVKSIRPQVDALRVYLNGFDAVPDFLNEDEGHLSTETAGDLGDLGKFYWLDKKDGLDHSHYLTLDDDLGYPDNYVERLVEEFDARDGKAIVGVQGSLFSQPIKDFATCRAWRALFNQPLERARSVHIMGTATTLFSGATLDLSLADFPMRNSTDLQLAIAAQHQRVPMIAIPRPENWLTEERPWDAEGYSIWKTVIEPGGSLPQTRLAQQAVAYWNAFEDPIATDEAQAV